MTSCSNLIAHHHTLQPIDNLPTETTTGSQPTNVSGQNGKEPSSSTQNQDRGRSLKPPTTDGRFDRSVSPGTLDDGSHELCEGEKGGNYQPPGTMDKFKNKFRRH